MLEKLCKTVFIFSLLVNCFAAIANNFTHQNVDKAQEILDKVIAYHGGKAAIEKVDNILVDYDFSINYRTQGYGYKGTEYHSNRPGNAMSLISYSQKIDWMERQYQYLDSFHSSTSLTREGKTTNYNNITATFTENESKNFTNRIESLVIRNPVLILKAVLKNKDSLRYLDKRDYQEQQHHIVTSSLGTKNIFTLYINEKTNLISKVETLLNSKTTEVLFSDYQSVGVFKLPMNIKRNLPDNYYSAYIYYHIEKYDFNPDVKKIARAPVNYKPAEKQDTYDGKLRMQTIGKGIYWLTESGANTIFVEFSDYIMAVDANNGRNDGLKRRLNKFREVVPNKPIEYVSISHQHHDHLDQVHRYAKQGTKIITAKAFIPLITKRINDFNKGETIKPSFNVVNQKRVYADETQRVEIYELKNMLHAETMLMTYFPTEQLIYLPDHYEDGYLIENHHATKALLAEIGRLGLKVKGFISGHGNDVYSLATIKTAMAHPIEMKAFRRQPHQSVTHSE